MEAGARLVLRTSAALRPGERVLIVVDEGTRRVGDAFALAARALGADPVLASIAPRAKDGDEPPEPIGAAMQGSDLILPAAAGTALTFRVEGREWIAEDTGLCAKKGAFTTLPAGEIFVAVVEGTAEGRLVARGDLGGPASGSP